MDSPDLTADLIARLLALEASQIAQVIVGVVNGLDPVRRHETVDIMANLMGAVTGDVPVDSPKVPQTVSPPAPAKVRRPPRKTSKHPAQKPFDVTCSVCGRGREPGDATFPQVMGVWGGGEVGSRDFCGGCYAAYEAELFRGAVQALQGGDQA